MIHIWHRCTRRAKSLSLETSRWSSLRRERCIPLIISVAIAVAACNEPTRLSLPDRLIVPPSPDFLLVGEALQLDAQLLDEDGGILKDRPILWTTSDSAVAAVDRLTGLVRAERVGSAAITARHGTLSHTRTIYVNSGEVNANRVVFDLGTLGGAEAIATGIDQLGHVVGWSHIPDGKRHAFVWKRSGGIFRMIDLGTLDGDSASGAEGTNDQGDIVGWSHGQTLRAVRWTDQGNPIAIGALGGTMSVAYAISSNEVVVGESTLPTGERRAFRWSLSAGARELPPLPGDSASSAHSINLLGNAVGWSRGGVTRAVYWGADGSIADLGTLDNDSVSMAYGINDRDQVVGLVRARSTACPCRAFLWTRADGMRAVPIAGTEPVLRAINNAGLSVGEASAGSGFKYALVVATSGAEERIGVLPNAAASAALAVSDRGRAVGWSLDAQGKSRAVIFGLYP